MSLIDEELESFSEEDVSIMINVIDRAVENLARNLEEFGNMTLKDLLDENSEDNDEINKVFKAINDIMPNGVEQATDIIIKRHLERTRVELLNMQNVITKLHLLKSRL